MEKGVKFFYFLTLFFLPVYGIRFSFFSIPINLLDVFETIVIVASFVLAGFSMKKDEMGHKLRNIRWVGIGFILICIGVVSSAYVSGGISNQEAGILKSWVVLPFFFIFGGYVCCFSLQMGILWYSFSAVLVSFVSFVLPATISLTYDDRLRGWYESPNQLAMYIAPALIILWFLCRKNRKRYHLFLVGGSIILGALLWTKSLGAMISVVIAILFGEIFLWKRKFSLYSLFCYFCSFCFFRENRNSKLRTWKYIYKVTFFFGVILFFFGVATLSLGEFNDRSSVSSRWMIWKSAIRLGEEHSFFGIGPGNFQEKYLEYQQFYPPYLEWAVPHPHNIFLAFWLFSGIIGLMGFFIVSGNIFSLFWKNKKTVDRFTVAVFCALLSIFLHGFVDTTIWGNALSVVFWLMIFFLLTLYTKRGFGESH